jgi:PilZ domain-containing protein
VSRLTGGASGLCYNSREVLGDLVNWFGSRNKEERRQAQRTDRTFHAVYTTDGQSWHPTVALDISVNGISVLTQQELQKPEVDFRLTLETRVVPCRMAPVRHETVTQGGRQVHKYALRFVAMMADDQQAVLRWLRGGQLEETHKAKAELEAIRMAPDDVARLFPKAVQDRLHNELVQRNRLAPVDPKLTPLVAYYYGGVTSSKGKSMHRLTIESKVVEEHPHKETRFRTRFMFDDKAEEIRVLD